MAKEIDGQRHIIKHIRKEGGYARKWSSPYVVGVPDLITCGIGPGALFIEVKMEKKWYKDTIRAIQFTEKQTEEAQKIIEGGGRCIGLIIMYGGPQNVEIAPVRMPAPREKLRVRLSELQRGCFKWRSEVGFVRWLSDWCHRTNDGRRNVD